ncbi:MAG: TerC family protein [Alphaproteobacteria bacterium]|nr:MAG: TerC family protein [Alphaproteobacteria bacterium]
MLSLFTDMEVWASLLTLTALEIVLGIDNLIFLSIISDRLPEAARARARRLGLGLALIGRIGLLTILTWIIGLTAPLFVVFEVTVSWRDLILIAGGLFLLVKATTEMHHLVEGAGGDGATRRPASFLSVIVQILLLDLVFSLDSILTAVGMTAHLPVMIAAIVIAMAVMIAAAEPVATFINQYPNVKMLAQAFLLLIAVALIADGAHFHIPRGYLYFAIAFSALVEFLNILAARRRRARRAETGT